MRIASGTMLMVMSLDPGSDLAAQTLTTSTVGGTWIVVASLAAVFVRESSRESRS